jgi:hypothetical protein
MIAVVAAPKPKVVESIEQSSYRFESSSSESDFFQVTEPSPPRIVTPPVEEVEEIVIPSPPKEPSPQPSPPKVVEVRVPTPPRVVPKSSPSPRTKKIRRLKEQIAQRKESQPEIKLPAPKPVPKEIPKPSPLKIKKEIEPPKVDDLKQILEEEMRKTMAMKEQKIREREKRKKQLEDQRRFME